MQFTAQQISDILQGTIDGNPKVKVNRPAKIEEAEEGCISFIANEKYEPFAYETQASILIVNEDFAVKNGGIKPTLIRVKDAYSGFSDLLGRFMEMIQDKRGIEKPNFIDRSAKVGAKVYIGAMSYIGAGAKIGEGAKIYPQVYIGDGVQIGANTVIYPGVKIYHHCVVGDRCIIHAGTVIGSDGFGFAPQEDGTYKKVPQTGNVVLCDDVEIGANSCIDRATMGSTMIEEGVKLDNLVQIAHNVIIGEHTVIASQAGISGSTKLGARCMIGGQAGIVGHVTIANGTKINAQSGVSKGIDDENQAVTGSPAVAFRQHYKSMVIFNRLPEIEQRITHIEQQLKKR